MHMRVRFISKIRRITALPMLAKNNSKVYSHFYRLRDWTCWLDFNPVTSCLFLFIERLWARSWTLAEPLIRIHWLQLIARVDLVIHFYQKRVTWNFRICWIYLLSAHSGPWKHPLRIFSIVRFLMIRWGNGNAAILKYCRTIWCTRCSSRTYWPYFDAI